MTDLEEFPFPSPRTATQHGHPVQGAVGPPCRAGHLDAPFSPNTIPCESTSPSLIPSVQSPPAAGASHLPGQITSPLDFSTSRISAQTAPSIDPVFYPVVPVPVSESHPSPLEKPKQLRLPSFARLGIATRRPETPSAQSNEITLEPLGGFLSPVEPISAGFDAAPGRVGTCGSGCSAKLFGPLSTHRMHLGLGPAEMTPPDEPPSFDWASTSGERRVSREPNEDPPGAVDQMQVPQDQSGEQLETSQILQAPGPTPSGTHDAMEAAIQTVLKYIDPDAFQSNAMKILSHALPSPSIPGHFFPRVIERLRESLPGSHVTWINLLHAVPGRFNLADLPVSPPTTPGVALGGALATEDYFTSKTFESAVQVADYASGDTATSAREHSLAPPSSVHLTVVERYIPPTSKNEFMDMFSTYKCPSLLTDRLIEIVPGNGTLLFIYPTRRGALTFCERHLGPVLDPLLRQMVVVNNFTADLSSSIGTMEAARKMPDFEDMRGKIETLCEGLGTSTDQQVLQRLHREPSSFSLVYSDRHEVTLDRAVWSRWWVKQEKHRVRKSVTGHYRMSGGLRVNTESSPTAVVQEILDAVETRTPTHGADGRDGIEVGVFVIKRNRLS